MARPNSKGLVFPVNFSALLFYIIPLALFPMDSLPARPSWTYITIRQVATESRGSLESPGRRPGVAPLGRAIGRKTLGPSGAERT
jgi:hypothetical protein